MALELPPLPTSYAVTRLGLHALAEHVLSPMRHRAEGRIGLRPIDGGFGPPLPDGRRVVAADGLLRDGDRSAIITTLGNAGRFLDTPVGAPTEVYAPTTDGDIDRPLGIEAEAATVVGAWFALGARLLDDVTARASGTDDPTEAQLWPEHFDYALTIGPEGSRANVGVSPGDADHDEPYVYIGPWELRAGAIWNESWGASLPYGAVRAGTDPLTFVRDALREMGLTTF